MENFAFDVPGGRLAGTRWPGRADRPRPTLVLLHSGICDRRSWESSAPALAGFGDVVAYDRRGFGDSPPGPAGFRHLDDLWSLLASLGPPAWLVGSSMGGCLALDAALEHPGRLAGLVLLSPAVRGGPTDGDDVELDADTRRLDEAIGAADDPDEVARLEIRLWLDGPAGPEGRVGGAVRDLALDMNRRILGGGVPEDDGAAGIEHWSRLPEISLPTTVAWGDLDVPVLIEEWRQTAERIPGARAEVIPGTAHLPYLERPGSLHDVVRAAVSPSSASRRSSPG